MKTSRKNKFRRRLIYGVFYAVGLGVIIYALSGLLNTLGEESEARNEFAELRTIASEVLRSADSEVDSTLKEESLAQLYEFNSDFVGWIEVLGTDVNYPVVRGLDNSFYLRRTFLGKPNRAGSIFMDYRAAPDFSTPLTVLYGHNMRDGSMFGSLKRFADEAFLEENTEIRVFTACGEIIFYDVIKAWGTDVWDDVYSLDFNNTLDISSFFMYNSEHFLMLSTCLSGAPQGSDYRFIVVAVRRVF